MEQGGIAYMGYDQRCVAVIKIRHSRIWTCVCQGALFIVVMAGDVPLYLHNILQ